MRRLVGWKPRARFASQRDLGLCPSEATDEVECEASYPYAQRLSEGVPFRNPLGKAARPRPRCIANSPWSAMELKERRLTLTLEALKQVVVNNFFGLLDGEFSLPRLV